MFIDLAIKIIEPIGKFILAQLAKKSYEKPEASITYYTQE